MKTNTKILLYPLHLRAGVGNLGRVKKMLQNKKIKHPCRTCPFRKSTRRGYLTFIPEREGTLEAIQGMLFHIDAKIAQSCHTSILARQEPQKSCAGFNEFLNGNNPDFIHTREEFIEHHDTKEGYL